MRVPAKVMSLILATAIQAAGAQKVGLQTTTVPVAGGAPIPVMSGIRPAQRQVSNRWDCFSRQWLSTGQCRAPSCGSL